MCLVTWSESLPSNVVESMRKKYAALWWSVNHVNVNCSPPKVARRSKYLFLSGCEHTVAVISWTSWKGEAVESTSPTPSVPLKTGEVVSDQKHYAPKTVEKMKCSFSWMQSCLTNRLSIRSQAALEYSLTRPSNWSASSISCKSPVQSSANARSRWNSEELSTKIPRSKNQARKISSSTLWRERTNQVKVDHLVERQLSKRRGHRVNYLA